MASQTLRTLKLSLLADVSNFGSQLDKAGGNFRKFSRGVEQASKFANVAIGALGALGASAVNAASDFEETSSAVEQIFGRRSAQQLQTFARETGAALGLSRQSALEAAQQFGIFGQAAGLAGTDLTDFTIELTTLAADLASFNNTTVDQAITALGAALRGESEPIRNYGVLLNAAAIENRALADGLIDSGEEIDAQTKILATFNEILEQTEIQQGDALRTADSFARQQANLTAELENFRLEIGEQLLPVISELLPELRGFVDTITAVEPERLIDLGKAILVVAGGIKALNAALAIFAGFQTAFKLIVGSGIFGVAGAAGAVTVATGQNLPQGFTGAPVGTLPSLERERVQRNRDSLAAGAGQRQTGNVIVSGVVGSTYQVTREIERFQNLRDRSRGTLPTPGVPQ